MNLLEDAGSLRDVGWVLAVPKHIGGDMNTIDRRKFIPHRALFLLHEFVLDFFPARQFRAPSTSLQKPSWATSPSAS